MHHMTVRLTVSLPDDLYAQVQRVAQASRVSASSVVRAAVAELVPRTTKVLDFMGSEPAVTQQDVTDVDVWARELRAFIEKSTPAVMRPLVDDVLPPGFPGVADPLPGELDQ